MTKKSVEREINHDAFAPPEPLPCGTCETGEATHQVAIQVQKGLDYNSRKQLYTVTYAICGECAKDVVEVKLGARLGVRR